MTLRSSVAGAVRPVLGPDKLQRITRVERRWRRAAWPRRLEPPAAPRPAAAGAAAPTAGAVAARTVGPSGFSPPPLTRHELLVGLHQVLAPRAYLEVGVNDGRSLALARCPSLGVDPAFKVTAPIHCDVQLVRATSDDFFAAPDAVAHLGGAPLELAFIDGMHLAEFAYRDFLNLEPLMSATGIIVLDDMLPRDVDEGGARPAHARLDRRRVQGGRAAARAPPGPARARGEHRPDRGGRGRRARPGVHGAGGSTRPASRGCSRATRSSCRTTCWAVPARSTRGPAGRPGLGRGWCRCAPLRPGRPRWRRRWSELRDRAAFAAGGTARGTPGRPERRCARQLPARARD